MLAFNFLRRGSEGQRRPCMFQVANRRVQANSLIHCCHYFYDPEDGGSIFHRNTGNDLTEMSTRNLPVGKGRLAGA
jgi:hypothetical protein